MNTFNQSDLITASLKAISVATALVGGIQLVLIATGHQPLPRPIFYAALGIGLGLTAVALVDMYNSGELEI